MALRSRLLLVLLTALALLGPAPSGAWAAGTGGLEVTPDPAIVDGHQVTAFHVKVPSRGTTTVSFFLSNVRSTAVTGTLYAVDARRDAQGHFTIGDGRSAKGVGLREQSISLKPHEVRHETFTVKGPVHGTEYRAVVIEVTHGAITERAATVVYLTPGRKVPVPLLLALVAGALVVLAAAGVALSRRRGRNDEAGRP